MFRTWVIYLSILSCSVLYGQVRICTKLTSPVNGASNVPVNATLSWTPVEGVPGYIISIGTTPGGRDITNNTNTGSSTSFTPPLGLPSNTRIYVTISLFFFNSDNIQCVEESFTTETVTTPPDCTSLVFPVNGSTEVPINTNLRWNFAPGAEGYLLSIGTSSGGTDILNGLDVGNTLNYSPPSNFSGNTTFYVRILPYNQNGPATNCTEEIFTTRELGVIPECTKLIYPANGQVNVPLTPELSWEPVENADGYIMSIGTTPFGTDVVNNGNFGASTSTYVIDFEPNTTFFVTITPYNDVGKALSCGYETFTTFVACAPYLDPDQGEVISLSPTITFPDTLIYCSNQAPLNVSSTDQADGYRWTLVDKNGPDFVISETMHAEIKSPGTYLLELYNISDYFGNEVLCEASKEFEVIESTAPIIINVRVQPQNASSTITIETMDQGDYEYALNDINGPYQNSNVFQNVTPDDTVVYVRDKNGCGTTSVFLESLIFPRFFTPNGDGINDNWQVLVREIEGSQILYVHIFDRYGKLLKQIRPFDNGWDGTLAGKPLPSSDYWYNATLANGKSVQGHFTLKR